MFAKIKMVKSIYCKTGVKMHISVVEFEIVNQLCYDNKCGRFKELC